LRLTQSVEGWLISNRPASNSDTVGLGFLVAFVLIVTRGDTRSASASRAHR
jgi:hypothetical protein